MFAYVGADLHLRFGLSFTAGRPHRRHLRHRRPDLCRDGASRWCAGSARAASPIGGGLMLGVAYLELAIGPAWWLAPLADAAIGLGFYMLHNTLQTNATQMTPEARGTAVALFSSMYLSRPDRGRRTGGAGDRPLRRRPLFLGSGDALPALAFWFAHELKRHRDGQRSSRKRRSCQALSRPRETRSISARTSRSTMPGRLSSSQDLSTAAASPAPGLRACGRSAPARSGPAR